MLYKSFYSLTEQAHSPGSIRVRLSIEKDHPIFQGHFPGHPVVPGVCMMQMVREVMEIETGSRMKISGAANMKFLAVINPEENPQVDLSLTYTQEATAYVIQATLFSGETVFFKLVKGQLQTI